MRRSDNRLARLGAFLMRIHVRRRSSPAGSRDERVLGLVEDEAEAELRKEAERLDAVNAATVPAQEIAPGRDRTN